MPEMIAQSVSVLVWSRDPEVLGLVRGAVEGGSVVVRVVAEGRSFETQALPSRLPHEVEEGALVVVVDDQASSDVREVVRRVLSVRPSLKVIAVTGRLEGQDEVEWRRAGVYFLMPRPASAELLRRVLRKAIEHETTRMGRNGR